jgi:hypothetical protein
LVVAGMLQGCCSVKNGSIAEMVEIPISLDHVDGYSYGIDWYCDEERKFFIKGSPFLQIKFI